MNFFKGKYIIALYDDNDKWKATYNNLIELNKKYYKKRRETLQQEMRIIFNLQKQGIFTHKFLGYNVFFIDVYEKHNDCFQEDDVEYLKLYGNKSNKDIIKELDISERTFYRKKKGLENIL